MVCKLHGVYLMLLLIIAKNNIQAESTIRFFSSFIDLLGMCITAARQEP